MSDFDATPVIIFVASLYAFGIVLLYVLAKAWEQALSTRWVDRGQPPRSPGPSTSIRKQT